MEGTATRDPLTGLMLLAAVVALVLGLTLPALTVERFLVFGSTRSIGETIATLYTEGHVLLGLVVTLFTIVFPVAKLLLTVRIWLARDPGSPAVRRMLSWTLWLGKWSMLDVFMAAIVVAVLTLDLVTNVTTDIGLYVFAGAIVLSMLAAHRLESRVGTTDA